jgi:hypothetical protein
MDEELRGYLESMEARIMTRMNDNQERVLERLRSQEMLSSAHIELTRGVMALLVNLDRRVTDLEKP